MMEQFTDLDPTQQLLQQEGMEKCITQLLQLILALEMVMLWL